ASAATAPSFSQPFRIEIQPEAIRLTQQAAPGDRSAEDLIVAGRKSATAGPWISVIVTAWATAMTVVIARLALSLRGAWRKQRLSASVTERCWKELVPDLAMCYGIRRPVSLRLAGEGTMPATWGCWAPVIFLPVEAIDWSQQRLRAVLLHEL